MGLQVFEPKDELVLIRALLGSPQRRAGGSSPFLSGPSSCAYFCILVLGEKRASLGSCTVIPKWLVSLSGNAPKAGEPVSEQEVEWSLHPRAEESSDQGPAVTTAMSN